MSANRNRARKHRVQIEVYKQSNYAILNKPRPKVAMVYDSSSDMAKEAYRLMKRRQHLTMDYDVYKQRAINRR
jgi:predicted component of type VI protein secretion system